MPMSRAGAREQYWTASAPVIPLDQATLHPCPQWGARQWRQGVTDDRCVSCGYWEGPTPQGILAQQEHRSCPCHG